MKIFRNVLILSIVVFLASCVKENIEVSTALEELQLINKEIPNWVKSENDVYIYISSKIGISMLSKPKQEALEIIPKLENKGGVFHSQETYFTYASNVLEIPQKELEFFYNFVDERPEYQNAENLIYYLNDRFNYLISNNYIKTPVQGLKRNEISTRCESGADALFSVLVTAGTLVTCGGCVTGASLGTTCSLCAIGVWGSYRALSCWFE